MNRLFQTAALFVSIVAIAAVAWTLRARAANPGESVVGSFDGQGVLERLEDDPFIPRFRLIGELRFQQSGGQVWVTPASTILDGRSVPTVFVQLFGHPLESGFSRAAVSYDYAVKKKDSAWEQTQRMFYEAAVTEGIAPDDAKAMYTVLSASGTRWALHGPNSCFSRCHVSETELEWRPRVDHDKLVSLLSWVRSENPSLDEIDHRAAQTIIEKGPHIFGNLD